MKKYYLDKVTAGTDSSCLVFEIDTQNSEEVEAINERIEKWNGYSFTNDEYTTTTSISEITAEEAKSYTILKAADYFPELAHN
ncbi:MAG: hypothetical protein J6R32_04410 [Bacteroidales bacterium]|nr:hypothetical protein [Bacteroidales bacterium]